MGLVVYIKNDKLQTFRGEYISLKLNMGLLYGWASNLTRQGFPAGSYVY